MSYRAKQDRGIQNEHSADGQQEALCIFEEGKRRIAQKSNVMVVTEGEREKGVRAQQRYKAVVE